MAQFKIQCLSHTPLMELLDPSQAVKDGAMAALKSLRESLERFDPTLIILFGPDHYNGFFYQLMPPFCVGTVRIDHGLLDTLGPVRVASEEALNCASGPRRGRRCCAVASHASGSRLRAAARVALRATSHGSGVDLHQLGSGSAAWINERASWVSRQEIHTSLEDGSCSWHRRLSHNPPVPFSKMRPLTSPSGSSRVNPGPEARKAREARTLAAARQFASSSPFVHSIRSGTKRS